MLEIKIATVLICAVLFALGGYIFLISRRYFMPVVLAISIILITGIWWLGFTVLPVMGTLCLGYKNFGEGNFARAIWLGIQALVIGLGLCILHHLLIFFYIPYIIIAAVLAGILNNRVNQILGDCIFGGWLGIIVFFVR